ncbi:MAG: caspase family protein [Ruminococcus sp.]|nr:caspase family protein [Ruminococcus sp.]
MKKVAMLVGNDNYDSTNAVLRCAVNDANTLAKKLEELEFDVEVINNINNTGMGIEMAKFKRSLSNYEVGLFFFAGHGFQFDGRNYLATIDTSFADESSTKYTSFPLDDVIEIMEDSNLAIKILIIDACRQGTFSGRRGMTEGFAPVFAPKGTIIAFATSPGQAAKEANEHGFFTSAILQHIATPHISIEEVFKRVRNTVYIMSKGTQITWEHTSLMGSFTFNPMQRRAIHEKYSRYALADYDYECLPDSKCYDWINAARSYNYNIQNSIIGQITRLKKELINEDSNDLFVLGRNLYQASINAFYITNFFDELHTNLKQFNKDVASHLLNGMAYEIYFDSKGKLRRNFKTHKYKEVLQELLSVDYSTCREFIVNKLEGYSQKVVYIPGGKILDLEVYFKEYHEEYVDYELYCPEKILLDGINIMYNSEGVELYQDISWYGIRGGNMDLFFEHLREKTVATQRGLHITYVADGNFDEDISEITIPRDFQLLKYTN